MIKHSSFFLLFFSLVASLKAQTLYRPRDISEAYRKQTRSGDGRPGKAYWQNTGTYHIDVKVSPPGRTIYGKETIAYKNNSPDTLNSLVLKLFLNNHKPGASRWGAVAEGYLTEGISIDTFNVNGRAGLWKKGMGNNSWEEVPLAAPLKPGDSVRLAVSWHYTISLQSGREGMIDSTTYYLAYFYPRIAVYDDYNGWDKVDFTGGPEFYNDFNNYTLNVEVPAGYVVWGTGDLLNQDEVLKPAVSERLRRSMKSDSTIHIATLTEMLNNQVTTAGSTNVWRFKANHVTDVALGLSNHFVWDAASALVDSTTGRRAGMQAAYADSTSAFRPMVHDGAYALNWYSHHLPGVPFPFPKMTAFQGNADMEYPMMINDSPIQGLNGRRVANHEIAHTWFPFYMGINETRYAFMDEAWATTLELLIAPSYTDKKQADETFRSGRIAKWVRNPSQTTDLPIITPSFELKDAYRTNAYGKPSLAYQALKDMLGDEMFKKCLHGYMDRWNGKHPIPWDFFYTFNDVSGQNLNWFWNNWFFSNNYIDIAVGSVAKASGGYVVKVVNNGGFAVPFDITVSYADGTNTAVHETPKIWYNNAKEAVVSFKANKKVRSVTVGGGVFVDARPQDNTWKSGAGI